MTATSDITKFWNMLYVDQGARIRNGLSVGIDSASNPGTWVQYAAFDASGNRTAPNIYTKTDVDTALAGKAAQSSTYTKTEVNSQISNSIKSGVLRLYDDDATERGIILHPTAVHFAVNGFLPNNRRSNHNDGRPNCRRRY